MYVMVIVNRERSSVCVVLSPYVRKFKLAPIVGPHEKGVINFGE